eukprot:CAMPEP_0201905988 /NCGR_PEP_ID=MMETSP0902-20130614/56791_1 /ASSEMBLY_ACC=CAM_ASM_000551 /TAXON_ID=420261 /ORGANISM="Thalassiosira antarctica, Strain CCMP982" /LENGTH=404 /DNA_ID=CAMNT_0048440113 /DNA_START=69 /DNA_END=1283 /DNA_ORIENTATION=-
MRLSIPTATFMATIQWSASFAPSSSTSSTKYSHSQQLKKYDNTLFHTSNLALAASTQEQSNNADADLIEHTFLSNTSFSAPKLSFRPSLPEERGKGGVQASQPISTLEVIARIPRNLIIATCDDDDLSSSRVAEAISQMDAEKYSWAADLCAATLCSLFPNSDVNDDASITLTKAKQEWIAQWESGGWATNNADLGPEDADWGPKCVTGSLLSTGSDNDFNVYAKFRFPTHPVVYRAGSGLAMLTGSEDQTALDALLLRGRVFRGMRDALSTLVEQPSTHRKGTVRDRKGWDVADMLSRMLARVTTLELGQDAKMAYAVVPIHERLAHCGDGGQGENSKLVVADGGKEVLLVATRDIAVDEEITRDYSLAPSLDGDDTNGPLRLLLQFGLPPVSVAVKNGTSSD